MVGLLFDKSHKVAFILKGDVMKKILIFLLPILIIITAGFIIAGFFQIEFQKEKLIDDIKRKTKNVAESIEVSAGSVLKSKDKKTAQKLVGTFQKRERFQGGIFYTKDGNVFAFTERLSDWIKEEESYIKKIFSEKKVYEGFNNYGKYNLYTYALPVTDENGQFLGVVEVVYDVSYVNELLVVFWKKMSIGLIFLISLISIIIIVLQRQIFLLPVRRITFWLQKFYKGETDENLNHKYTDELGKFASEIEQVALNLRIARKSVSESAKERIKDEKKWTPSKLKDLVNAKLGEDSLFVVSNREPYMHVSDEHKGKAKCVSPASGVVTALDPVMRACGGMWIAHGSGNADKQFVNSKDKLGVPPNDIHYILKRIWLSKEEEKGYYFGFSNEGLWPLCHITHNRPTFREFDWQMYKKVNQKFADSIIEELPKSAPFIFIQDYHFTLLARMIKKKRPDAKIAMFWHIPWPNPEVFAICPYQKEILNGMLGCDLIGFHIQYHCNNFLDTANRFLESRVDTERFSVVRSGKETFIKQYPISVDNFADPKLAGAITSQKEKIISELNLEGKIVALGIERIDYTKGLAERMLAIDRFLEKYPQYKGKFVLVQLAAPSRTQIKKYHDLMAEIDELVEKINWKHSENSWKPIIYFKQYFSSEEIKPYYQLADICVVSSLHDGMNLVAKEYVAAKNDLNGTLILSEFAGASRELTDAILINPYSIEEFAEAFKLAVEMPQEEKEKRMKAMRSVIENNNVYKWAGTIISDLISLKKE